MNESKSSIKKGFRSFLEEKGRENIRLSVIDRSFENFSFLNFENKKNIKENNYNISINRNTLKVLQDRGLITPTKVKSNFLKKENKELEKFKINSNKKVNRQQNIHLKNLSWQKYNREMWKKNSFLIIYFVFLFCKKLKKNFSKERFLKLKRMHYDIIKDPALNYEENFEKKLLEFKKDLTNNNNFSQNKFKKGLLILFKCINIIKKLFLTVKKIINLLKIFKL